MSFDRSRRWDGRFQKASRQVKNKRRWKANRGLQLEFLEPRCLLAGLTTDFAPFGAAFDNLHGEGEGGGGTALGHHFNISYLPSRVNVWRNDEVNLSTRTQPSTDDPVAIVKNYLTENASKFGLSATDVQQFAVTDKSTNRNGVTYVYGQQSVNGLQVMNALVNATVTKTGEILNAGVSFVPGLSTANLSRTPAVNAIDAFNVVVDGLDKTLTRGSTVLVPGVGVNQSQTISAGGLVQGATVKAELAYLPVGPGQTKLVWKVNMPMMDGTWYEAFVSAEPNEANRSVEAAVDWINDFSYNVFARPTETPQDGIRQVVVNPHDPLASPFSWHDVNGLPGADFQDTRGNNVFAQEDRDGPEYLGFVGVPSPNGLRPSGGTTGDFNSPIDLSRDPLFYTDAATTNLFYWVNINHDIHFHYGFTEEAGNFQSTNYTQLGQGGDPVYAFAQAGANLAAGPLTRNNAFMATPPDGTPPIIAMFEFDLSNPRRDGDLDGFIITHEFGHGVTNRLTGGPNNAAALQALQSGGMGEGWSDFFGLWFTQKPTDTKNQPQTTGNYVLNQPATAGGVRRFPYSFDLTIDPLTLNYFNGGFPANEVHNAGEIWASVLWDMNWLLIEKYGYDPDLYNGRGGNNVAMNLVITGLKLQPANPSFLEARDAILAADTLLNKGVNHNEIWQAFGRRGFGINAIDVASTSAVVTETFDMPAAQSFVSGKVWSDDNGNATLDGNEQGLAGVTLFVDMDGDAQLDRLEPTTTSAADGTYQFSFNVPGSFAIGQVVPTGFEQTFPNTGNGTHSVLVLNGQTVGNINFGDRRGAPSARGIVYFDEDGDGRRHPFDDGMGGIIVYADKDDDKRPDLGERQTTTAADGTYSLLLSEKGTFFIRQSVPPGFIQTQPAKDAGYQVTVVSGTLNAQFEFGNTRAEDWGDAPSPYPTLAVDNGAVNGFLAGFFLGKSVDLESNGNPNLTATGDDLTPVDVDDEDGVVFNSSTIFPGGTASVDVTVNLRDIIIETVQGRSREVVKTENAAGRLHAWIDFNRDGDWDDAGEKVFSDLLLMEGTHRLTFPVPRNATPGVTFARFRYGYEHLLGPTGRAMAGEVEDHLVRILSDTPDAIDDVFSVDQNSTANFLDVLANDVASSAGPITILSASATTNGGTVLVSPDRLSLRYTPRRGFIGNDSFSYTIRDPAGATDTARVSVTVLPAFAQPIAVDDSFDVNENSANNELNVLANDLPGRAPPVGIVSFTSPANGTADVDSRGTPSPSDDVFRYSPNVGFAGTDVFQYTIEDAAGQRSSAMVTIHVQPGDAADDLVQFRAEVTDINNKPIVAAGVGETFKLRVFVDDLRADDGVDDNQDLRGVGAAYLDVLFPFNLVSIGSNIIFSPEYQSATSGDINTPGVINEVGALQTSISTPTGPNEVLLFEVSAVATGVGTARFAGDPADQVTENPGVSPDHDTVLFEPPNTVPIRQLRFVNTSLQIVGSGGRPQATDNTFNVPVNSIDFSLTVLANDVERDNPPLRITAVGSATATNFTTPNGGRVTISADNLRLLYTPRSGFSGTEQFSYTVANSVGLTASAVVTVQVGAVPKDVTFRVDTTDLLGQHIDTVLQGGNFQVRVFVQDVRANPPDRNRMGAFAAYLDLLYDGTLVSTVGDVNAPFGFRMEFGPAYTNGQSASNALPNIIDELGAFQESFSPLGPSEFLLAAVTLKADKAGVATFVGDPANISPLHDVLLFEPDESAVPLNQIGYRNASIQIVGLGEGEVSLFQNPRDRFDVNNDGFRSPQDALVVVNHLNVSGSHPLTSSIGGEAESGPTKYLDVNGDRIVSPIDALQVINRLNGAQGEGESVLVVGPGVPDLTSLPLDVGHSLAAIHLGSAVADASPPRTNAVQHRIPSIVTDRSAVTGHDQMFALLASDARPASENSDSEEIESLLAEDVFEAWTELDLNE